MRAKGVSRLHSTSTVAVTVVLEILGSFPNVLDWDKSLGWLACKLWRTAQMIRWGVWN